MDDLEHLVYDINQFTHEKKLISRFILSKGILELKINYFVLKM